MNSVEAAREIRKEVVQMQQVGTNVGSAMSCADILAVLYFNVLKGASPGDADGNRFILSKGHAASALYAALALRGVLDRKLLKTWLCDGSMLTGHPSVRVPGVAVATGSLGHGLPMAAGMAVAAKHDKVPQRFFVLLGDGEMQEGSVWEGAMLASRFQLDNLTIIIDANNLQGYDRVENIQPVETFRPKLEAFGWSVAEINGHNHASLTKCLTTTPLVPGRPTAIVARTIKGKGVAEMEDKLGWHYFSVPPDKVQAFLQELEQARSSDIQ